jgi:hypothetical protein
MRTGALQQRVATDTSRQRCKYLKLRKSSSDSTNTLPSPGSTKHLSSSPALTKCLPVSSPPTHILQVSTVDRHRILHHENRVRCPETQSDQPAMDNREC